jgi:hypothetical protein
VSGKALSAKWSDFAVAEDTFEASSIMTGWLLMLSAITQLVIRSEVVLYHEHLKPSILMAFIVVAFLFLIRPRLGSHVEWRGVLSALIVFATTAVGFTHLLANQGDWPLARIYTLIQNSTRDLLATVLGQDLATFSTSPLYLVAAAILLVSFAYQSYKGFLLFVAFLLVYGLYPWNVGIVTAYLLWAAGFFLVRQEVLYLPRTIEERLKLNRATRDLLLEARNRTLYDHEVRFLLVGSAEGDGKQQHIESQVRELANAGLLEFNPETKKVHPTPVLMNSFAPEGLGTMVNLLSSLAALILMGISLVYLAMPVDFLPESILGPIGLLDDIALLIFASLPLGSRALAKISGKRKLARGLLARDSDRDITQP